MTQPDPESGDAELLDHIRHHIDVGTVSLPDTEHMTRTDVMTLAAYFQLRGQAELCTSMLSGAVDSSPDGIRDYLARVERVAARLWRERWPHDETGGSEDA